MLSVGPRMVGRNMTATVVSTREKPRLGRLDQIPSLPPHPFARRVEFDTCRDHLLRHDRRAVVITSPPETGSMSLESASMLRGAGGAGKSVLAAMLARDESIRRRFPDGIYWVAAGQGRSGTEAKAILLQADLAKRLGSPMTVATPHLGKHHLTKLLAHRACLVILDDIRDTIDARRLDVIDRHSASRILITTREGSAAADLEAIEVPLNSLSDEDSAAFLSEWNYRSDVTDIHLQEIASEFGRRPLALAILGALANGGLSWKEIVKRFHLAEHSVMDGNDSDECRRSIGLAIDTLKKAHPTIVDRYQALAVFPSNVRIPESVVAMYWEAMSNQGPRESRRDLELLARLQLLTLEESQSGVYVMLDNIRHDYVVATHPGLTRANHLLVEAYRGAILKGWETGPDDGYFFQHFTEHLRGSGSHHVVRSLLLNPDWMTAKLRAAGIVPLIADYEPFATDKVFAQVQGALRLSAAILERDPSLLRGQLQGRLEGVLSKEILQQLEHSDDNVVWLRSLAPSLTAPGGPLIRTLDGHHASVRTVVLTPDGKHALSASNDTTLRLWNVETGKTVRELRGHANVANAVTLSPDGKYALSASDDHTLRLWKLSAGETVHELIGHTGIVSAAVFTPDAHHAVSASWDHTLRLWNLGTGGTVSTMRGHADIVTAVVILPDGKRALSASWDHTLRIWDLATGESVGILRGHTGRLTAVVITPDGKHALSASWDHTLRLWDLATGETVREFRGHTQLVTAVAVTPDGKRAISASHDQSLRLWDLGTGETIHELRGHSALVNAVALTHDGQRAVSASWDQTLRVWNLATGKSEGELQGHTHLVNSVTLSVDGGHAFSTSWDQTLQHWEIGASQAARDAQGRIHSVNAATLSPDGTRVLTASFDHTLHYWNLATGKTLRELKGHTNLVTAIVISRDGNHAVSASWDQTLRLWDLASGKTIRELRGHNGWITSVALTPDGTQALSASNDKTLRLWDLASGRTVREFRGHTDLVNAVALSNHGTRAISTSWDHTLRLWDLETGRSLREIAGHAFLTAVALTPDGKHALTASNDHSPRLWNIQTGETVRELKGHTNLINAVALTPDGKNALTASDDHTLRLWNLTTGMHITSFAADSPVMNCGISADGSTFIARDSAGRVHLLRQEVNHPLNGLREEKITRDSALYASTNSTNPLA